LEKHKHFQGKWKQLTKGKAVYFGGGKEIIQQQKNLGEKKKKER